MSVRFEKNGNIICSGFFESQATQDMEIKVLNDGSVWARIFWHDVSSTVEWFASSAEVLKCLNKSNRYSRMYLVDKFKTASGVYEFMLTYPKLSSTLYNRWSQTSSPNAATATGFVAITTAWSYCDKGIVKSQSSGATYYDCNGGQVGWYGAIGQYGMWTSTQYIPAANSSSQRETELWVRIDSLPDATQLKIYNDYVSCNEFIEI